MIKKLIIVLLYLLFNTHAYNLYTMELQEEIKTYETEPMAYSNVPPKNKIIFTGSTPESFYYNHNKNTFQSRVEVFTTIRRVLNDLNFEEYYLDSKGFKNEQGNIDLLFGNKREDLFFFLNIQENSAVLIPIFHQYTCKIHQSVLSRDKWQYPRPVSNWYGRYEDLYEMSWRYIDSFFHSRSNRVYENHYMGEDDFERCLYNTIKTKGLEKTVIRSSLVFNKNNSYSAHILYDNELDDIEDYENSLLSIINLF